MSGPFRLAARDGYSLGATLYRPRASSGRGVLVMPATGVPQEYYAKFSDFLATRGFTVLTFDYRGIGKSLTGHVRQVSARMQDWALLDASAAFDYLQKESDKLYVVGHSFGGQAIGLLPRSEKVAGAFMVGSQSGYWKNWPLLGRAWLWPVTHVALPMVSQLRGYFPSSRLGFGEDLPKGVAIEWARWCRNPTYLVGDLGVADAYARFAAPLRAYAISDDPFAPAGAVQALLDLYPGSRSELKRVRPSDIGAERIGHFGFFRERFRDTLWRDAADWLEKR